MISRKSILLNVKVGLTSSCIGRLEKSMWQCFNMPSCGLQEPILMEELVLRKS